jgi:hypothetical protein
MAGTTEGMDEGFAQLTVAGWGRRRRGWGFAGLVEDARDDGAVGGADCGRPGRATEPWPRRQVRTTDGERPGRGRGRGRGFAQLTVAAWDDGGVADDGDYSKTDDQSN